MPETSTEHDDGLEMKEMFMQLRIRAPHIAALALQTALPLSTLAFACSNTITIPGSGGDGGSDAQGGNAGALGGRMAASGGAASGMSASNGGRAGATVIVVDPQGGEGAGEDEGAAGDATGSAGVPSIDPDDACALSTDTVKAIPSILELVIDTSGSMDWPPGWAPTPDDDSKPPGATKWEITRDALDGAVADLAPEIALGASFFPNTTDEDDGVICLRNEVGVPIARLGSATSAEREAFQGALSGVVPNGGTPTQGAYRFGLEQLSDTNLAGSKFILLITDGTPTCTIDCECNEGNVPVDSDPLIADARAALDDGVRTFVIGSPGSEDTREVLSALATAGGTAKPDCSDDGPVYCHFDMTTEPDLAGALANALDQVSMSLRSCEYPIPEPPDDRTLDRDKVNVLYTPSGGKAETIPRDSSASECTEGWQYSEDGEHIVLCGDACDAAKADVGAKVEVLFGCETVSSEPR